MELFLENVTKEYKDKTALRNVNATLHSGQLIGLIGKNGAGKTTLLKLLSTILKPTSGRIMLDGQDIVKNPNVMRSTVGYLPQEVSAYPNLTILEYLSYIASVKGVKKKDAEKQINSLLTAFHLEDVGSKRMENCSGGMKQRTGIICALLGDPQIIIIDEPTTGLDPEERIAVLLESVPFISSKAGNAVGLTALFVMFLVNYSASGYDNPLLRAFDYGNYRWVMVTMALINFCSRLTYENLLSPMILARSSGDSIVLGTVNACMGIGGIAGGIIVSVKKESSHKAVAIYVSMALSFLFGDLMMAVGKNAFWWSVAAAAASLPIPFVMANQNTILYRKIPAAMQGRVFAVRNAGNNRRG